MTLVFFLFAIFIVSWSLVRWFRSYALNKGLLDNPNARSSHTLAIPRGGGLVFLLLWMLVAVGVILGDIWTIDQMLVFLPGAVLVGWVGYWDDHYSLAARWRASVHFLASVSGLVMIGGMNNLGFGIMGMNLGWLSTVLAVFVIVWSINLFNFMDGTDGIAGVEALFIFGVGGLVLWQADGSSLAIPGWILAATVAGFLVWNWPKAKIFMGDVGSGFLGFMIAMFAIAGEIWYKVPVLLWLILYGVFWFDATITLVRRILAREKWYAAHRSHAYQRLHHIAKWSHKKILMGVIIINTALSIIAIGISFKPDLLIYGVGLTLVLLSTIYCIIEKMAPMYGRTSQQKIT